MSGIIGGAGSKSGVIGPPPAFSASATVPSPNSYITFQTKYVDTHNCFDTSNGIYTAPITGNYYVAFKYNIRGYVTTYIRIDNVSFLQHQTNTAYTSTTSPDVWESMHYGGVVEVKAGQTIRCYMAAFAEHPAWDSGVWNMFSGHYIGMAN